MKLPVPSQKLLNLARAALALLLVTYAPPRLLVALAMDKGLQAWWSALPGLRFDGGSALWGGVDLLLFLGGIALGESAVRNFLEPRSRTTTNEEAEPRRFLILPLSALASPGRRPALGPGASLADTGLPQDLTLAYRLADDLAALAEYKRTCSQREAHWTPWKWEQTLRAIHHHCRARPDGEAGPLAHVVFVVSNESLAETPLLHRLVLTKYPELSHVQMKALCKGPLGPHLVPMGSIPKDSAGWNFEDFGEQVRALSWLLEHFKRDHHAGESDMTVDATGGQKLTSVAAAAVTFNSDIRLQYVTTNPVLASDGIQWLYPVRGFDLHA